jgi:hypothetical protein
MSKSNKLIRHTSPLTALPTHSRPTTMPHTSVLQTSTSPSGLRFQTSIVLPLATTKALDPSSEEVRLGTLIE